MKDLLRKVFTENGEELIIRLAVERQKPKITGNVKRGSSNSKYPTFVQLKIVHIEYIIFNITLIKCRHK